MYSLTCVQTAYIHYLLICMYLTYYVHSVMRTCMHIYTGIAFAQRMQLAASRLEGETHSVESVTARLPVQFQGHRQQGIYALYSVYTLIHVLLHIGMLYIFTYYI